LRLVSGSRFHRVSLEQAAELRRERRAGGVGVAGAVELGRIDTQRRRRVRMPELAADEDNVEALSDQQLANVWRQSCIVGAKTTAAASARLR
jgi:hypothetical protein